MNLKYLLAPASILHGLVYCSAVAGASVHRQPDANGVGNCVFSPQPLPFEKESDPAYAQIKRSFSEGEDVHVRCYLPKPVSDYRDVGKIYNSLRDENEYHARLVWVRPNMGNDADYLVTGLATEYTAADGVVDQQRFDIEVAPNCDFNYSADVVKRERYRGVGSRGCVDLGNFIRAVAAEQQLSLPMTARFCVQQHVNAADKEQQIEEWDPALGKKRYSTRRIEYRHLMTRSCFDYQVNPD